MKILNYKTYLLLGLSFSFYQCALFEGEREKPNVIIVLTDDQGIGGLSCQNNPYLETPNLDQFYKESTHLTDFHVSPLSTPTRGAIISGRYPIRNGAWATFKGRDILSHPAPTIAEVFKANGYSTAQIGKWHLGDNYPSRAIDSGFEYTVNHRSGGVGELSDYWGNNYFNDTYFVNEQPQKFEGYCTDVWFDETQKYIEKQKDSDKPFFIYLATNAPHSPHYVDEKYKKPYLHLERSGILKDAGFYGQIANLDENFGKLDQYLKENNLDKNTIVIFLTDNGAGMQNNAWTDGYSGAKGQPLEGGHRVPFYIRWHDGNIRTNKDVDALAAHVDILPTLAGLCKLKLDPEAQYDGIDLSYLLEHPESKKPHRSVFIHHKQDYNPPHDEKGSVVAYHDWRLINGHQLYNLANDKIQQVNLASTYPEVVGRLQSQNAEFVRASKEFEEYQTLPHNVVSPNHQPVTTLTIQHAMGKSGGLWEAEQICEGIKVPNNTYAVEFEEPGDYRISLCRWPRECPGEIWGVPAVNPKNFYTYETIKPESAQINIFNQDHEIEITDDMTEASFELNLPKGKTQLVADFVENDKPFGAYYVYIEKI